MFREQASCDAEVVGKSQQRKSISTTAATLSPLAHSVSRITPDDDGRTTRENYARTPRIPADLLPSE